MNCGKQLTNLLLSKMFNSSASAPKVIKVSDVKVDNPTDIANYFNEFFCIVGRSLADKVNRTGNENLIKILKTKSTNLFSEILAIFKE